MASLLSTWRRSWDRHWSAKCIDGRISVIDYPITDKYVMAFQITGNSNFSSTAFSDKEPIKSTANLCKSLSVSLKVLIKALISPNYSDVIMSVMVSLITSLTIIYSILYSGAHERKYQSFASLAFVRGIHRWPVYSPHKEPVTRKMVPFDDVIMSIHVAQSGPRGDNLQHQLSPLQTLIVKRGSVKHIWVMLSKLHWCQQRQLVRLEWNTRRKTR